MATYILDKTKCAIYLYDGSLPLTYDSNRMYFEYYFKIDNNGNVNISKLQKNLNGWKGNIEEVLIINDNIPIPDYFIDIINFLINPITFQDIKNYEANHHYKRPGGICNTAKDIEKIQTLSNSKNNQLTERYWEIVTNVIKKMKENVKKIVENPQDNLDIKAQLDTYITKTTLQQENIVELETKIENIQTYYFDVLNDNKKLKEILKTKNHKETELECEINRLKEDINAMKQLEEIRKHEQQKMEDLEKERLWIEYKRQKQNYNPLSL